jgi:hypothetical protein
MPCEAANLKSNENLANRKAIHIQIKRLIILKHIVRYLHLILLLNYIKYFAYIITLGYNFSIFYQLNK